MEVTTLLPVLVRLIVIGAFAEFLAGLLGVGGSIVLATSLATMIVTSIRSTKSHHKKGAVDWLILRPSVPRWRTVWMPSP
jgi:uncharacterized membrane protein YfcA|tara:strand:- start:277 stop:516 length:240 start_codon:yes stop_codon:yes gene_type:complete